MKMHKPTQTEFDAVLAMLSLVDVYLETGTLGDEPPLPDDFDPDEDDAPESQQASAAEFVSKLESLYRTGGYRWEAVLWAGDTAIRNACDPDAATLEWRREIKAAMAAGEKP